MPTDEITIEDLVNWYCEYYGIELWKDLNEFECQYQMSNTGKIRNKRTGKILRPCTSRRGYLLAHLSKDGKDHMFSVHQLVAKTWVPNPLNHPQVNHIDENILNNNAANLEWCDNKFNCNWGTRNDRLSKQVVQYNKSGELVCKWKSLSMAGRTLKIDTGHISDVCRGVRRSAGGYVWKYA